MSTRVIYQHPLAFLLGLEGIALLRGFAGEHDREFTLARLEEIRRLLDGADALGGGVEAEPIATRDGYATWAAWYDEPGNQLIDLEQPVVQEILAGLPVGVALDAACGTGRHTAYLASLGHRVIGVDESPEMLAVARAKVPAAELHEGDLHDLPLADDSVDLVVCALALVHVPELGRAFAELVRVLRPGGRLVVSDSRGLIGDLGGPAGAQAHSRRAVRLYADLEPVDERVPARRAAARPRAAALRGAVQAGRHRHRGRHRSVRRHAVAAAHSERAARPLGAARSRARSGERRSGRKPDRDRPGLRAQPVGFATMR